MDRAPDCPDCNDCDQASVAHAPKEDHRHQVVHADDPVAVDVRLCIVRGPAQPRGEPMDGEPMDRHLREEPMDRHLSCGGSQWTASPWTGTSVAGGAHGQAPQLRFTRRSSAVTAMWLPVFMWLPTRAIPGKPASEEAAAVIHASIRSSPVTGFQVRQPA